MNTMAQRMSEFRFSPFSRCHAIDGIMLIRSLLDADVYEYALRHLRYERYMPYFYLYYTAPDGAHMNRCALLMPVRATMPLRRRY